MFNKTANTSFHTACCFVLSCLFILLSVFSEAQILNFENYTVEQGLSSAEILCATQDSTGRLYIGTNKGGINVYDGTNFTRLTEKDGLPSNNIYSLQQFKGGIFIGTDNGVSFFDGKKFRNYNEKSGFPAEIAFDLKLTKDNAILIATNKGIFSYDGNSFSPFIVDSVLNTSTVFSIYTDQSSAIWFCTAYNGLFKYNGTTTVHYSNANGLKCQAVYSIIEKENGIFWAFTEANIYELNNGKIKTINPPCIDVNHQPFYYCSLRDKRDGAIWIGTDKGLIKYFNNEFTRYTTANGLINDVIWKIFQDKENNLWFISKENGIAKLSSERFLFYTPNPDLENEQINTICNAGNNKFWIATQANISLLNNTVIEKSINIPFNSNYLNTIAYDSKNSRLYLASDDTLIFLSGNNFKSVKEKDEIKKCFSVLADRNGDVWLGTINGLMKLEKDGLVYSKRFNSKVVVYNIHEDRSGKLWLGTEKGVYTLSNNIVNHFEQKDGLPEKAIQGFFEDKNGDIYIASEIGLFKYSESSKTFTKWTGLSSNNISSVVVDKKGQVWVGTPNGIDRIILDGGKPAIIKHYGMEDGFLGQGCFDNSVAVDNDGNILWGAMKGLVIYQPQYDYTNTLEPYTQITDVRINGDNKKWLSLIHNSPGPFSKLSYTENNFVFHFIGVSLTASKKVRYQYMLKGFDKTWQETPETQIQYPNLDPGTYEFVLKACNSEGLWNTTPVSFGFTIYPPFYQTWWFYTLCIAIILGGIFSYIKIRRSNIQILAQQKIIASKNTLLENANAEIAQYNKNIMDSITYARRIQRAILPANKRMQEGVKDLFTLFKPKDIVSGDFFWYEKSDSIVLFACVDCTGHGVPGALMSMVGNNGLTRSVNEFGLSEPGVIMDKLNELVDETLNQNQKSDVKDGMDMSMIMIDRTSHTLHYSGANNAMYLVRKKGEKLIDRNGTILTPALESSEHSLYEIKPDKQPIGAFDHRKNFTNHTFEIKPGDKVYLFTDGYADQFGGPSGKKFMYKPFKNLILAACSLPMREQKKQLQESFQKWKGPLEQVDDVCVIGITLD